ncbi:MAG: DUF4215 domain-containing protein [Myxococcota bacterium]|nr:DUF4215 domain-containing protein [Myxococcota bacterium]
MTILGDLSPSPNRTATVITLGSIIFFLGVAKFSACTPTIAPISPASAQCRAQEDCNEGQRCHQGYCLLRAISCNGDGQLDPGEACDDGNTADDDGCTTNCFVATCGDGIQRMDLQPGASGYEACDDGNLANNDNCRNNCQVARCGDGIRRLDRPEGDAEYEACDDGNRDNEDDCNNTCRLPTCGDGILRTGLEPETEGFEECDDGNPIDSDGCLTDCRLARCGDGQRRVDLLAEQEGYEECDDGNDDDGDECTRSCRLNFCGDGLIHAGTEACDDGNRETSDDCVNCQPARCGDGFIRLDLEPGLPDFESCDDGNTNDADACRTNCLAAVCGDGVVRRDISSMETVGYEACEPGLDHGLRYCRPDCKWGPRPQQLAVLQGHVCLLRGGRVWCWGLGYPREGEDLTSNPRTYHQQPQEIDTLNSPRSRFLCSLYGDGTATCNHPHNWASESVVPPANTPLMDLNIVPTQTSYILTTHGDILCFSALFPEGRQIPDRPNLTSMKLSPQGHRDEGLTIDASGRAFRFECPGTAAPVAPNLTVVKATSGDFSYVGGVRRLEWFLLDVSGTVWRLQGDDVLTEVHFPAPVVDMTSSSASSACFLDNTGNLYCHGYGNNGQRGGGDETVSLTWDHAPTVVEGLEDVVEIAGNNNGYCALEEDGDVLCWGINAGRRFSPHVDDPDGNVLSPRPMRGLPEP